MGVGRAAGGGEEPRQRVRGLELERACARALRDAEGFSIGGLCGAGVALSEDVASDPVKKRIRTVAPGLLGERETLRDRGERVVDRARLALKLARTPSPIYADCLSCRSRLAAMMSRNSVAARSASPVKRGFVASAHRENK